MSQQNTEAPSEFTARFSSRLGYLVADAERREVAATMQVENLTFQVNSVQAENAELRREIERLQAVIDSYEQSSESEETEPGADGP